MLSARYAVSLVALSVVFAGCGTMDRASSDPAGIYWSYAPGDSGPDDWARIGYTQCGQGQQSPIVLDPAKYGETTLGYFYDNQVTLNLLNDGHTVKDLADPNTEPNWITFDGDRYVFDQFHFHTPSEHTDVDTRDPNGRRTAMELHVVNYTADRKKAAAIAVLIEEDPMAEDPAAYQTLLDVLPQNGGLVRKTGKKIDLYGLLPKNRAQFYTYVGSLTTPNCDPNVRFFVLKDRVRLTPARIDQLRKLFQAQTPPGNSRPTNGRRAPDLIRNFR